MTDPINVPKVEQDAKKESYPYRLAVDVDIATDELADGGMGDTWSSRFLRWKLNLVPHPNKVKQAIGSFFCKVLGNIQPDHDLKANIADFERSETEEARTRKVIEAEGLKIQDDK